MPTINRVNSEKPKIVRKSSNVSDEDKVFKEFYNDHQDVLDYLCAILSDIYNLNPSLGFTDYLRDVETTKRRFKHEGLSFATKTLPGLFNNLLVFLETGESSYPGFKIVRGEKYPVYLQRLFSKIYKVNDADRVKYLELIYQFCVAFKKLKGPYRQSVLRHQLTEFVQDDIDLRYLEILSEANKPILYRARAICKELLKGLDPEFQPELFMPRPGPGATNTPVPKHERFRPHVLYTKLNEVFPYEDWFFSHPWDLVVEPHKLTKLERVSEPTSRFKFVPKTFSKPRGICIEQLETQWLQQGVKNALYTRLENHPETSGKINFSDQSINGVLALKSSESQDMATIDMSSASDLISRELVSYLTQDNHELHDALMALSVETIEIPDEINFITDFPCAKFAPMGSAICFPIMSLVHYALCRAIIDNAQVPRSCTHSVYVYGDDIVIPSECVQAIYDWLPRFGMKLNTEKSYYKSKFRESCGIHAYNGKEITPVYFKSIPKSNSRTDVLISCLQLETKLFYKGFTETAKLLRERLYKVKHYRAHKLPVVSPKSEVLGWIREPTDAPLHSNFIGAKRRYNPDLQRFETKQRVVRPFLGKSPPLSESEGYLRYLLLKTEDSKNVRGSCERLQISYKWIPDSAL